MQKEKGVLDKKCKLKEYYLFIDSEGLIRIRSRLHMSYEQKCSIILPKRYYLTEQRVRKYQTVHDSGVKSNTEESQVKLLVMSKELAQEAVNVSSHNEAM